MEDGECESCDRLTFLDGGGRKSVVVVMVVAVAIVVVVVEVAGGFEMEGERWEREELGR